MHFDEIKMSPAVQYDDDILGSTGGCDVPGSDARVVVIVETRKVCVPLSARVHPRQSNVRPEVLPSGQKHNVCVDRQTCLPVKDRQNVILVNLHCVMT